MISRSSLTVAMVLSFLPTAAQAQVSGRSSDARYGVDDKKHPLGAAQRERRRAALRQLVAEGQSTPARVMSTGDGRYVELEQARSDRLFVLLVEYGDKEHPEFAGELRGPRHNEIPEPDRALDNSTIWKPDFSATHYAGIIGEMNEYFGWQSSGRYGLEGETTEWVKVKYNASRYGRDVCGSSTCTNVWELIKDGLQEWIAERCATGMSLHQVRDYLSTFDVWDRYDYDLDGNFDEPDGYIDHFLVVHAGAGQETGGGLQGDDAIWSHRWFAYYDLLGSAGPAGNLLGGTEFPGTGIWIGDYTIQPENGGLGVFAHEYGHDLGLPDEYDTAGGDNSTGFWTLMSSGSYLSAEPVDIGSRPGDLNAWDKLQLGWLAFDTAVAGEVSTHTLGPAEYNTDLAQALVVSLPERVRTLELATPPEGDFAWWSNMGNDIDNSMVHPVDVPASDALLELTLWYDIEQDWDYGYVSVSSDDGVTWETLAGSVTTNEDPNGQNQGNGITGTSSDWVTASFDLGAYAGQSVFVQVRYVTDSAVAGKGLLADAISVRSAADGTQELLEDWVLSGFEETTGVQTLSTFNAYIAENRQYLSYDSTLATGPYNFGFAGTLPDWVERFPYQNGLLVSYWDDFYSDNNTSQHPGEGMILPIDAHPDALIRADGLPWRARIQGYDSTFGLEPTDAIALHLDGVESQHPSLPAVPVFDDLVDYYRPIPESAEWSPWAGVAVPPTGTQIRVLQATAGGAVMRVTVQPSVF